METLTPETLSRLKESLTQERTALLEELAEHGEKNPQNSEWQANTSGSEGEESDPNDVADAIEELVNNVPIVHELDARLVEVELALQKMDLNTYGTCEIGGEPIALERLMANPAARSCVAHQA